MELKNRFEVGAELAGRLGGFTMSLDARPRETRIWQNLTE